MVNTTDWGNSQDGQNFLAVLIGVGALVLLIGGGGWLTVATGAQQQLLNRRILAPPGTGIIDLPHLGALDLPRLIILTAALATMIAIAVLAHGLKQAKKKKQSA